MKNALSTFFFILISLSVLSQDNYDFTRLQGLKSDNGDIVFEIGGYDITVSSIFEEISSDILLSNLKDKFHLGDVLADYSDAQINYNNRIIEAETDIKHKTKEKQNQVLCLIDKGDEGITVLLFQTYNQRDIVLEQSFIKAFLDGRLDGFVSDDWSANTILFMGQEIQLGTECKWVKPHNVACGEAQFIWSEFLSYEDALLDTNNRIRIYSNDLFEIVEESDIDVLFEDIPSVAHRVVYRKRDFTNEPFVIYYYLVQEIDERYVSCVLSNPSYYCNDYGLASLLQQVMSIPALPEDVYEIYEVNEVNEVNEDDYDDSSAIMFEIQAGSWVPVGRLSNIFGYAPTLGVFVGFPIKNQMSIDLGVQIAFPVNKGEFDFNQDGTYYETEGDFLLDISLRWRKYKDISRKLRFSTYLGVGFNMIQTDVERLNYEDDLDKYEALYTVDVLGGASLHYRRIGAFVEYHYTPYSIGNKVDNRFGSNALNIGLSYSFISR